MPSAHRNAIKKILASIEWRIAEDEKRLLIATSDEERAKIVEELADLHIRQGELKGVLLGDGDSK